MKLIHLSDLHLGKRVNEFSMIEDQEDILIKIINIIDDEKPDGVMIAGDVYDRSVPPEEAMRLWDDFLNRLVKRKIPVFAVYGNHDSAVRFSDHSKLIGSSGVHLSPVYNGEIIPYTLEDEYGKLNIYMLPFIKPVIVRSVFPDELIEDYTGALRVAISHMNINPDERNILISHQFVTGAVTCDSEEIIVGGLDNVNASVFDDFDYVALGHIHGRQKIKRETIRYSGTPLKYSFSEKDHKKSVTVVEFKEKDNIEIREVSLIPKHDMREIRGTYDELVLKQNYEGTNREDYLQVVLTDEEDVPNALAKLRIVYPNIMKIVYDNKRTKEKREVTNVVDVEKKTPIELFNEFYEIQNNQPMSEEQREYTIELIESIWGK